MRGRGPHKFRGTVGEGANQPLLSKPLDYPLPRLEYEKKECESWRFRSVHPRVPRPK